MEEDQEELKPRNYQVELFNKCVAENTIIFLPTGTGKTFIAIMVLKQMGGDLKGDNHKVTIILVNTVALVDQHTKYVKQHTPFECGGYSGEMNVDYWKAETWHKEFQKNQVLVMTCEILAGIVRAQIFDLNRANLLIFDECHHGVNDHSMRQLMINFENLQDPPRVIGLTATLLNGNCKPHNIMSEVRSLEITFHSKVATVDGLEKVVGYATNPVEVLKVFKTHVLSSVEQGCIDLLDDLMETISFCKFDDQVPNRNIKNTNLVLLEPADGVRKVNNFLKDLILHIQMLGIHGGRIACFAHYIQIERLKKHCDIPKLAHILCYIQSVLGRVTERLRMAMASCKTEKERFWKFSSDKVLALVKIIDEFRNKSEEALCGLIFVERRFTAKCVFHILDILSKSDSDYSYIRSNFIIGHNNNPNDDTRESLFISKKNKQVLDQFVNKEINLLCTSQVLEEGIDIPKCTFVCKFDIPKDYRSYIQSKGRARHQKSHYYILIPQNTQQKFDLRYKEYQLVEEMLNEFLIGNNDEREGPTQDEIDNMYNENILPPYFVKGPGSAYISAVAAVSLLTRYCQMLPSDQYTLHNPEWYIERFQKNNNTMYCVSVYLPTICPLIDPIKGIPMMSKKIAKRAAAYVACIKLHQCGELDDFLLPRKRVVLNEDVSFLFTHHPKEKETGAGIKKVRLHDTKIADACHGSIYPTRKVYLHLINIEPLFHKSDAINDATIYDMYASDLCYGILTPHQLPPVCNFPIYVSNGTLMISIVDNVKILSLSEEDIGKIRRFHFVVFNDVLNVLNSFLVSDVSGDAETMILVPLRKSDLEIDFDVIEANKSVKKFEDTLTVSEKIGLVVNDDTYLHKIVFPTYRRDITTYIVTKICYDQNPKSDFPNDSYKDFREYYMEKHQESIVNQEQPLLFVKAISQRLNLYKPQGVEKKRKKIKVYDESPEYLIPELLVKQEFPASLWIQGKCLPTILSRLTYLLRIQTLWAAIGSDCHFFLKQDNMRPLELNLNLITYNPKLDEKEQQQNVIIKNYEISEGLPALPPCSKNSSCNKDFQTKMLESSYPWKDLDEPKDISRSLEVTVMDIEAFENFISSRVGGKERKDVHKSPAKQNYLALTYNKKFEEKSISVIKDRSNGVVELADIYEAMTTAKANDIVNLERLETLGDSFLKYIVSLYIQLRFPKFDEGRSTQLKGRIISNKNLFYIAKKCDIGGLLKNRDLVPKDEWLPPGFCIPHQIKEQIDDKSVSVNCLFDFDFPDEERVSGIIDNSVLEPVFTKYVLNAEDEDDGGAYHNMVQFLKQQCLKDKCLADVVEAILGAYLLKTGIKGCIKVIHWLGIIPPSENLEEYFQRPPTNPIIKPLATHLDIKFHLPLLQDIEAILGYTFTNKGYLLQALTHASYSPNRVTQSYEKLEFLGDAVLDFLVTCFIYESCGHLTPGQLTDLRSALVNNNTFASYVVRLGLHKYLLVMNSRLQNHIDKFVEFLTIKNFEIDDEVLILLEEEDVNMAEYIDVPKALGDVFESLAGAIFLDSGYNLEEVWKVVYRIMWREIDSFSANVPMNMVRRLYESEGAYPQFSKAHPTHNGRVMVKLHFHAKGIPKFVHGFGSNKVLAKKAAAKIALRYL